MKNPCEKCEEPKRYIGCHGHCDDEAAYKEWERPKKEEERSEREKDRQFTEFRIERIEFCKRRVGME